MNNNRTRREFLKQCALYGALGTTSSFTSLGTLSSTVLAATRPVGYRAMVCVYLEGGNDCNMLVKDTDEDYAAYLEQRGSRALNRDDILKIESGNDNYGIHPAMTGAKQLYDQNKLSFIANVGALKEPTTAASYQARSVDLPPKLFSHITQKNFIRSGLPFEGERRTGWAGRIADRYDDDNSWTAQIPMNLSASGTTNVWQEGTKTKPFGYGGRILPIFGYRDDVASQRKRREALLALYDHDYNNIFLNEYGNSFKTSIERGDFVREATKSTVITLTTTFPATRVGRGLKNIADLINSRVSLGVANTQQAFYFHMGGFDTHNDLAGRHSSNLKQLSDALLAFNSALEEMGLADDVLTFTNSDFGRTSVGNQSGSDHGWGGHQLVMGGQNLINGGQVFGTYPLFSGDDPQYIANSRGILVPSTSHNQMSATIAKWYGGFTDNELDELLPNLSNFSVKDLGFVK